MSCHLSLRRTAQCEEQADRAGNLSSFCPLDYLWRHPPSSPTAQGFLTLMLCVPPPSLSPSLPRLVSLAQGTSWLPPRGAQRFAGFCPGPLRAACGLRDKSQGQMLRKGMNAKTCSQSLPILSLHHTVASTSFSFHACQHGLLCIHFSGNRFSRW